jgi:hypothetical protein
VKRHARRWLTASGRPAPRCFRERAPFWPTSPPPPAQRIERDPSHPTVGESEVGVVAISCCRVGAIGFTLLRMLKRRQGVSLGASLALTLLSLGCSVYAKTLKPKAVSSLHCDESQVTITETSTLCQVVTGCGRSDVLVFEADKWTSFRERLAFELTCADADIDIKILTPTVYGVTGCGKKVVYKYVSSPQTVGIFADTTQVDPATASPAAQ